MVNETYKDKNITTSSEPSIDEDVVNKAYLDAKTSKVDGQVLFKEAKSKEKKSHSFSSYETYGDSNDLVEIAVKTFVQFF